MKNTAESDKANIYGQLDHFPEPENYRGKIPWDVQCQIAATSGTHYKNAIGKLTEYPVPKIPIQPATGQQLLLDIGCGWGRWMTAAGRKNYIPIGIDIRPGFCETARTTMSANGVTGYTVAADLQNLPFRDGVFDAVWSFSIMQHTHRARLLNCIGHIKRVLKNGGFSKLGFPNKDGIRNRFGTVPAAEKNRDDLDSWDVRYYTPTEYRDIFAQPFRNFSFENHSFLGIGVQKGDIKYTSGLKNKAISAISLGFSAIAAVVGPMKNWSDSIYVSVFKEEAGGPADSSQAVKTFLNLHSARPGSNLNLLPLAVCPISGGDLFLSDDGGWLVSGLAGKKFPVIDGTPVLIASEGA